MKLHDFRLIAAPMTPMHADGALNLPRVRDLAAHLVAAGVRGAFVAGTTGEGQSLTVEERIALAETWAKDSQRTKLELFVHVGHNCQGDAIRLAQHASAIKADAIALHGPTWWKRATAADLIDFCVPVAGAAPSLPFYLYDIPLITGLTASSAEFMAAAKSRIPTLAGIKYTNPDCVTVQECIQQSDGAYDVLWGTDEALLVGIAIGAKGAVGSTYNFAAPIYRRVLEAVAADDWPRARSEQARAIAMVRILQRFSMLAAFKFVIKLVGIDCGPVRAPVANLSESDQAQLRYELERHGFLSDFASVIR